MPASLDSFPRVTFQRERIADAWDEALPLMLANHDETGALPGCDFAPDREKFEKIDELGMIRAFTARINGVLVGYAVFIVSPHLHYRDLVWGVQDVVFVLPAHRGRAAIRFLRWQDEELAGEGVDLVYRHVEIKHDYSRTLLRMDYHAEEQRFVRDLRPTRRAS